MVPGTPASASWGACKKCESWGPRPDPMREAGPLWGARSLVFISPLMKTHTRTRGEAWGLPRVPGCHYVLLLALIMLLRLAITSLLIKWHCPIRTQTCVPFSGAVLQPLRLDSRSSANSCVFWIGHFTRGTKQLLLRKTVVSCDCLATP